MADYVVEFSGKKLPGHVQKKLSFKAPSDERANEWVSCQMKKWSIHGQKGIVFQVTEKVAEKTTEKGKKDADQKA